MSHTADALVTTSINILRAGQASGGAFVACPTYPTYRFAWLRDGAFCAYAMDRHGQTDSAAAFHSFVADTILAHRRRVGEAIDAARQGGTDRLTHPIDHLMLPTRFTLDGQEETAGDEAWPNFQLDGYGTWLWALADHVDRGGALTPHQAQAAALVADYVRVAGDLACYDCWEEFGDKRHTATRAAVNAGLAAAYRLLGGSESSTLDLPKTQGGLAKFEGSPAVDASLLWVSLPFGQLAPADPVMRTTAQRIIAELVGPTGGVRRYLGDTFYGGGEWIILTAWLGWYHASLGDTAAAAESLAWIRAAATGDGLLPEQLTAAPQDPAMVEPWVRRWGQVATPLLWSHAMYLVLVDAIHNGG